MTEVTPKKKRTWLWVVAGIFVLLCFVAVGGILVAVSFFRQNLNVTQTAEDAAMRQFDEVRNRFPGQQPLIQLVDDKPQFIPGDAASSGSQKPLTTLHVIAFDRDEGNLVTFSLPFWLLRMKSGPIRLSAYQQGWDDRGMSFRVEDIEKRGPGIIVDATERGEGRVIIWAE